MIRALIAFVCLTVSAWAETPTFAEIPWGSSRETVKTKLAEKGYLPETRGESGKSENAMAFKGRMKGIDTQVFAYFVKGGLQKIYVNLLTEDEDAIRVYREMLELLSERYGNPTDTMYSFKSPYRAGDGFEEQAVKVGKAMIASVWAPVSREYGLMVEVEQKLTVAVTYETRAWSDEVNRRQKAETDIF